MDFSKPSAFPPKSGSFLAQNKIPREMLASYRPQNDFEPVANDFQQMAFDPTQAMMSQYYSYYQYQNHYLEPFVDPNTPYSSKFPRARDYNNEQSIIEAFPHLEGVNDANFNIESVSPHAQFYIMRSGNDDNIHKAIKYHIWTTTTIGKNALRQAWQEFLDKGLEPEIYLVFSVVNSNQFLGVAKMTSTVNDDDTFKYWWEPCKWFGTVQVKWLFIKDIPHAHFEHITEGDYSASVITSRDSTPISADSGKMILQTFKDYPSRPNIFESFDYMDRREDYIRSERDSNPEFQKFFDNCCQAYKNDPESVQPQRKPYYPKKSSKRSNYPTKKYNSNYYREKTTFHKKGENPQATRANTNASDEGHYVLRKDKPNHRERNQRNERKKIDVGGPEDYPDLEEANRLNKNAKHSNGYHTKKQNGLNGHAKEHVVENGESADIKTN